MAAKQDGRDDMYLLAADYGGCFGAVVTRFYTNLKRYTAKLSAGRDYPVLPDPTAG